MAVSLSLSACAQPAPRLLVRADDMGSSHTANVACIQAVAAGIARSIEVMVPGPWYPEAVQMLAAHPGIDVGVHLVLTSEWSGVKWGPLTTAPSLVDDRGYFHPFIWPNEQLAGHTFLLDQPYKLEEIEQEWRAQIERAMRDIPGVTHLSGHMGCTHISPEATALAQRLADAYGLKLDGEALGLERGPTTGNHRGDPAAKQQALAASLHTLARGHTYLLVTHPGLDSEELRATGHKGYEDVAIDRAGDTQVLTDAAIGALIDSLGIELISYQDL
ncbi:MAG: hypothetical protein OHK0039_26510 [Bacteroidia bacterium]